MIKKLTGLVFILLLAAGMSSCKLDMDLYIQQDGSGTGTIIAQGSDIPDDPNGFKEALSEKGFKVTNVESYKKDGDRIIKGRVAWDKFSDDSHPLYLSYEKQDAFTTFRLNKENIRSSGIPYEARIHVPGKVITADGASMNGSTLVYPGPEKASVWRVTYKYEPGGAAWLFLTAALALLLIVPVVIVYRKSTAQHKAA